MKYFFDTEFIEGFHKPLFGKKRHFIDLISIGIVCEDGREYYAISNEFNSNDADAWVRENVIDKIEAELFRQQPPFAKSHFNFSLKELLRQYGKSNKQIAEDICLFCYPDARNNFINAKGEFLARSKQYGWNGEQPEFYAYYADYDWVLFCSLFGRMIDLPKGFPMYCKDLKQIFDEKAFNWFKKDTEFKKQYCVENNLFSIEDDLKLLSNYPKQGNEHNALDDAQWNFKLFKFLETIKV